MMKYLQGKTEKVVYIPIYYYQQKSTNKKKKIKHIGNE